MIFYITTRTTPSGREPALHKTPTCVRLLKAGGSKPVELTEAQAKKRKRCRYCFPEEATDQEGR